MPYASDASALKLSKGKIALYRKQTAWILGAANKVKLDFDLVDKDVVKFSRPEETLVVTGENDLVEFRKIIQDMQKRRSSLTRRKVALLRASSIFENLWEQGVTYLLQREAVARLRNEGLRSAAFQEILGELKGKKDRTETLLEQIDALLWSLKDNQLALELQLSAYKEEMWSIKHGVD